MRNQFDPNKFIFWRTLTLIFKNTFKNERTYIFCYILPLFFCSLIFIMWHRFGVYRILPPSTIGFVLPTILIANFYISIQVIEWRTNDFFKRVYFSGVSKTSIFIILSLLSCLISLTSFYFVIGLQSLFSTFLPENWKFINISNIRSLDWYIWFFVTFTILFSTILILFFYLSVSMTIGKNKNITIAILLFTFIFSLLLSETIIIPSYSSQKIWLAALGFINPAKYCSWLMYFFVSYSFIDSSGVNQIIPDVFQKHLLSFNYFIEPLVGVVIFLFIFILINNKFIKWSMKG